MTDKDQIQRILDRLDNPNLTDRQIRNLERQLDRLRDVGTDEQSA